MDNIKMTQEELKSKIINSFGSIWNIRWRRLMKGYEVSSSYPVLPCNYVILFLIPGENGWKVSDGGMMKRGDYFDDGIEGRLNINFDSKNKKIKLFQEINEINYKDDEYYTNFCNDEMLTKYMMDLIEFITYSINSTYLDYLVKKENEEKKN